MNPSSIKGASFWGSWPLLILKTPKPQAHRFFLGSNRLLRRHLLFLRLRKKVTKRQGIHNSEVRSSWAPGVPNLPSLDICQKKSDSNIDLSGASRCCQGKVSHCFAVFSPPENPAHKKKRSQPSTCQRLSWINLHRFETCWRKSSCKRPAD